MRRLSDLELQKMRGMKQSDYRRQRSIIEQQIKELGPAEPKSDGGILLPTEVTTKLYSIFDAEGVNKTEKTTSWPTVTFGWSEQLAKELEKALDREVRGIFYTDWVPAGQDASPQGVRVPAGNFSFGSAAEKVWKDHAGVILCECDSSDCNRIIAIDHDSYIKACGVEGYYRLTHEDCPHGCLNYWLSASDGHWKVWAK